MHLNYVPIVFIFCPSDAGWKIWLYRLCGFSSETTEKTKDSEEAPTEERKSTKEAIQDLISFLKENEKQKT